MKTLAIDLDYQAILRNRCVAPREIELYPGRSPGRPHRPFMGKHAKRTSHLLLDEGCVNSPGDEFIAGLAVPMHGMDEEVGG
ncbi:MAG TPA: hypothetical protein VIL46_16760 [Gemmataceae bacterium]